MNLPFDSLWSRRDLLRVGSLSLAASLAPGQAARSRPAKERSVILLWMAGGVTHIDGLDPKPDAPAEVRGPLRAIDTCVPGIRFCETLPCLAKCAERMAVLRGYTTESDDHFLSQAFALSGRKVNASQITSEPNVGAVVSYLKGPRAGLPGYLAVPGAVRPDGRNLLVGGWLGEQHGPFAIGGQSRAGTGNARTARNVDIEAELRVGVLQPAAEVSLERLGERRSLREQLESAARVADRFAERVDHDYRSAFDLLTAPKVRAAFDLKQEAAATKAAYGHTKLGRRCLLARRLVEAGARFVMVDYGYDADYGNLWDNHCAASQDPTPIVQVVKQPHHLAGLDRAFAALIADLAERGRLEQTLIVFLTEFGRTPTINKTGGRDHWGKAGAIFLAGGGVKGGQVIGASNADGGYPVGRSHTPADVAATIYRALDIDPHTMVRDRQQRPIPALPSGAVIPGVL